MPVTVNLRELETDDLEIQGEIPLDELDMENCDPMVRATEPARYALNVQKLGDGLLLTGALDLVLDCECVRCLKPFRHVLHLTEPLSLPLEGEEALPVDSDAVDLTPPLRELILLAFPPHPVCRPDCGGLSLGARQRSPAPEWTRPASGHGSPWDKLDNLKL